MRSGKMTIDDRVSELDKSDLFADLKEDAKRSIAGVMERRNFRSNEVMFTQASKADGFYLICSGSVKIFRLGEQGREQILHILSSGELCGEVPVFQGGSYPAGAIATNLVSTLYISGDAFIDLGQENPDVLFAMLAILSKRLRRFVTLIDDLALKEVSARVAKHILDLCKDANKKTVELTSTKTVLAARLGTIAETLSRTLKKLRGRKIIEVEGSSITVVNFPALKDIADGEKL